MWVLFFERLHDLKKNIGASAGGNQWEGRIWLCDLRANERPRFFFKFTITDIWVSFLRSGIGSELRPLKKKVWNFLSQNVKSNLCFFNCLWEIFFSFITRKKTRSLWHHYTTVHNTKVYPCTLHYSSVVYKSMLHCSVVLYSGVRVTWIFPLVMKL